MKSKLSLLCIFGALLFTSTVSLNNKTDHFYDDGLVSFAYDEINEQANIKKVNVKKLDESTETVKGSKLFVQYGNDGTYDYLRYAVALKGNIESINFTRRVPTYSSSGISEVSEDATTIYRGILANDSIYYYNELEKDTSTEGLTTDSTYMNDYYWACYSIKYSSKSFREAPVEITVSVNDGEFVQTREMILNNLKNNITHEFFAVDDETEVERPAAPIKNVTENCVGATSKGNVLINFPLHSSQEQTVRMYAAISASGSTQTEKKFDDSYDFYINNELKTVDSNAPKGTQFKDYDIVELGTYTLNKGTNNVSFSIDKSKSGVIAFNFRSLKLVAEHDVCYAEKECESKCQLCLGCLDELCEHDVCLTKCDCSKSTYSILNELVSVSGPKSKDTKNECIGVSSAGIVNVNYNIYSKIATKVQLSITMSRWTSERNIIRSSAEDTAVHAYSMFINGEEQFSDAKTIITSDSSNVNLKFSEFDEIIIGTYDLIEGNNTILISADFSKTGKINVNFRSLGLVASANAEIALI